MKKTMLAGAFTLVASVAFAEELPAPVTYDVLESFESYSVGNGVTTTGHILYGKNGTHGTIADTDNGSKVAAFDNDGPTIYRPDDAPTTNLNYLNLSTEDNTLYFAAKTLDGSEFDAEALAIDADTSYYIDTMVKFTASEEAQTPEPGAKIAIWTQKDADAQEGTPATLCIAAGTASNEGGLWALDTEGEDENIKVKVTTFETTTTIADGWHRLTVKATMLNGLPAFDVYIDGSTTKVGTYYSLSDAPDFTAVGFTGTGAVDDVKLTAVCPDFLIPSGFTFTLSFVNGETLGDKLATAEFDGKTLTLGEALGDTYKMGESKTVTVTAADGWFCKLYKDADGAEEFTGNTVTFGEENVQLFVDVEATDYFPLDSDGDGFFDVTADNIQNLLLAQANGTLNSKNYELVGEGDTITIAGYWPGIGGNDKQTDMVPFTAQFEGNNKTINVAFTADRNYQGFFNAVTNGLVQNLTINVTGFDTEQPAKNKDGEFGFAGAFGVVGDGALVKNIKVTGTIGSATQPLTHNAGGVAIRVDGGTLENCENAATVYGSYTKIGGVATFVSNWAGISAAAGVSATFKNCVNSGNVIGITSAKCGNDGIGGILAYSQSYPVILENCSNTGTITAPEGKELYAATLVASPGTLVTATGCSAQANMASVALMGVSNGKNRGNTNAVGKVTGLTLATVDDSVATFVAAPAAGDSYKLMNYDAVPALELAKDETVSFDTSLVAEDTVFDVVTFANITAADGCDIQKGGEAPIVTFTAVATATGPTVDEDGAQIDLVGSDYVVTPATDKDTITISDLPATFEGKVIVPVGTVDTIVGVPAEKLQLKVNGVVIPNTCFVGGDATGFDATLGEGAKPAYVEESDEVKPLVVGDATVSVTITAVPGLKYELLRETDLTTATFTGDAVDTKGVDTETTITLEDSKKPEGKAFYKVRVSKGAVELQ